MNLVEEIKSEYIKNPVLVIFMGIIIIFGVLTYLKPAGIFLMYGGVELEAYETNQTGNCYTLAQEKCVQQKVFLINLTKQNLLICPEGYYSTQSLCEKAFNLIEKPTITCYFIEEDECKTETLEVECPSIYFKTIEECESSIKKPSGITRIINFIKDIFKRIFGY